jgi:hypothetical protein
MKGPNAKRRAPNAVPNGPCARLADARARYTQLRVRSVSIDGDGPGLTLWATTLL